MAKSISGVDSGWGFAPLGPSLIGGRTSADSSSLLTRVKRGHLAFCGYSNSRAGNPVCGLLTTVASIPYTVRMFSGVITSFGPPSETTAP